MHVNLLVLSSAGKLAMWTVGAPAIHGAGVAGIQGAGVGVPKAAAVAAMTAGLAGAWHMPKGMMFSIGTWSMMFASGVCVSTRLIGSTASELGATPMLHFNSAPMHTCNAMIEIL
jgi:hypothetical protein